MSDRQTILGRVREALGKPTADVVRHQPSVIRQPEQRDDGGAASGGAASGGGGPSFRGPDFRGWLPSVTDDVEHRKALFAELSEKLKTNFIPVPDRDALLSRLGELKTEHGWERLASHHNALNDAAAQSLGLPMLWTDEGYDKVEMEQCDAAITGCDALIAQTGSVLVSNPSAGGRALSVLPPHHVVLATVDQLLPDLVAGYQQLKKTYGDTYPSFISFITGPSRTGDIERTLVLGAHGPKKLTVLLLENP